MAEDIVSLELDSRGDIIQESSAIMITADAVVTVDITVDAVILDNTGVVFVSGYGKSSYVSGYPVRSRYLDNDFLI